MSKTLKKIWNIVTWLLVALVVLMAVLLVGVRLIGFRAFTILSGSMEPSYHVGSLVYVKPVEDLHSLQSGDVITYTIDENTVVTHRVLEVIPDEDEPEIVRFRTKGDANDAEDGSLAYGPNVIGKVVFSIPLLGYVANYIQNPPGTYIAIAGGAVLLLLVFLPDLFGSEDKKKGRSQGDADPEL